ncbi:hypothetical protein Mycch_4029 [Mycolicibacterium chubuense NBB4]|uniref:Uncharacterized protein n=1 Tax=Mycolicibacterium chubuense (strain NBB4) TaxID=710421 RepID=I4BN95_MYCCN|nr:hypothetical protein [Mycolicibacterium chubuense]AFM18752.1 hypothetical protein Mycch_4029 [Mycolicibacterium chubuense NBB4]
MNPTSLEEDLHEFAIELRKLAYTMPGGCEDPLIRLSERMAQVAEHASAFDQPRKGPARQVFTG